MSLRAHSRDTLAPRRARRCAGIALAFAAAAFAQLPPAADVPVPAAVPARTPAPDAADTLETITVEAPEPRYVAPTSHDHIGRIWAPVLIDGHGPYRLVLDTGAGRSALVPRVAEALGKPIRQNKSVRMRGVTGDAVVGTVAVDTLSVGDLDLRTLDLPVVPDVFGGADGVLGTEGLTDLRIVIEFRHDHIELRRSHNQRAPSGYSVLPLAPVPGRGIVVPAVVGSVPVIAIIDTGAQATVGNLALRERLRRQLANAKAVNSSVIGATQDVQEGEALSVPPIRLGSTESRGVAVTFIDLAIFRHWHLTEQPTILIGMDVLGVLDTMIIDYRRRELQLRGTQYGFLSTP